MHKTVIFTLLKLFAPSKSIYLFSVEGDLKLSFAYLGTISRERELYWITERARYGEDIMCMPSERNGLPAPVSSYREEVQAAVPLLSCMQGSIQREESFPFHWGVRKARYLGGLHFFATDGMYVPSLGS